MVGSLILPTHTWIPPRAPVHAHQLFCAQSLFEESSQTTFGPVFLSISSHIFERASRPFCFKHRKQSLFLAVSQRSLRSFFIRSISEGLHFESKRSRPNASNRSIGLLPSMA